MNKAEHIAKNIKYAVAGELLLAVLKFISRRVFVLLLGREYLGLNGLFTDVLSMLSLAELGFSVSITYSLYRPVAQGDTELVKSLIRLYRRVYRAVGLVVLALGLSLLPFLSFFVKEMPKDIPHIPLIYVLNLANAGISYFFSHKSTLLFVHQKKYVETSIRAAVSLAATAAQIITLFFTRNYLYYLCLSIAATVVQNIAITVKADRLFPYLRERDVRPLPPEILGEIRRNVRAMLLLFDAITPALGNLTATEPEARRQTAFRRLNFFSGWLFGWMSICLFCLYDPFIDIWLGRGYLLPKPAVLLIVLNFYVNSMRTPVNNTKSVLGLFWDDRYKSILEAVLNLVVSVLLAQCWGAAGIMAGTLISTLAFPFWCEPLVLCRRGLRMSVKHYFTGYFAHLAVTAAAGALTWLLCRALGGGLGWFLLKCLLCAAVPNAVYLAVYRRREELSFFKHAAAHAVGRRRSGR